MKIQTLEFETALLDRYPRTPAAQWLLVTAGNWSQSPYHSGYIEYYLACLGPGAWALESVQIDPSPYDDEEQYDDDESDADDDVPESESEPTEFRTWVAAGWDMPADLTTQEIADLLYEAAIQAGCPAVEEVLRPGGLVDR